MAAYDENYARYAEIEITEAENHRETK